MNPFDFLMIGNAVIAAAAVYQLRICTLILAGNNVLLALALGNIVRYGPSVSQRYLPAHLFSEANLSTASVIMAISLTSLVGFTMISVRRHVRIGPDGPAVPWPILVAVGVYLLVLMSSSTTIFTGAYSEQRVRYDANIGGAHALLCALLIYELARRRFLSLITARKAFLISLVIFTATGYNKGTTGFPTGALLTSAFLVLPRGGAGRRLRNLVRMVLALGAVVVIALMVRHVRTQLSEDAKGAVVGFFEHVGESGVEREERGEGIEGTANASQNAAHILECITLYDAGISREWRSIYDVVEYTFKPSFLLKVLGLKRSIEAAWELADHFVHGGGIDVFGEFYWNGGLVCVAIMATALAFFCFIADREYRTSPFWLMMVCQFAPSFLMGYGYGFAQISRGAINGLLVAAGYKFYLSLSSRHAAAQAQIRSAPAA